MPEDAQAGQVDRGGEQREVSGDFDGAPDSGSAPAVPAAHQVPDLTFYFGSGRAVVTDPRGVLLAGPGRGQLRLVLPDRDAAPRRGGGALRPQRAVGADGTEGSLENYGKDVAAFLMWAAEPKLEERKETGFKVMLFLIVFASLLYFTKRRIWANVAH